MKYIIKTAGVDPTVDPRQYQETVKRITDFITGPTKVLVLPDENGLSVTVVAIPEAGDVVVLSTS